MSTTVDTTSTTDPGVSRGGKDATSPAGRRTRTIDAIWSILIGVAILAALQWVPRSGLLSERVVPTPASVGRALGDVISSGALWPDLWSTLSATLGGFLIATVAAVIIAALLVAMPRLERIATPYIVGFQTLPKIAVAPLVILWLGFGSASKVAIVSFLSFFPVFVNCLQGFRIRDRVRFELFASLGASPWQLFRHLRVPAALPYVFAGLNVGLVFALVGAVVAEFVGARNGLGVFLLQQKTAFNVPGVFAALVVLMVVGLSLHFTIRAIERRALHWTDDVGGA